MKYTRYNVRKSRSENVFFVIIILMVLILAYIIGSIVSKVFFSKTSVSIKNNFEPKITSSTGTEEQKGKVTSYVVIQGGTFDNKDNAEAIRGQLQASDNPFISEEEGKYKIIIGIYTDDSKADQILKTLTDKKIDSKKTSYKISVNNICDAEAIGIANGCLEIIGKIGEKNVHAVQTSEFKKWTSSLKEVDKNSSNISTLNDMKSYVKSMSDEVSKGNVPEINKALYTMIKKMAANVQ